MRLRPSIPWFRLAPLPNNTVVIDDCAINDSKLADCAVITSKINNDAVTYAKIQNVNAQRLLGRFDALAGDVQEIALGANLSFDSDAGTIIATGAALADCGVTPAKLQDSAVTTVKINDCAVTASKIADSAVGNAEIADCSIGSSKIQDCGIATGDIADCAVTTFKMKNGAISFSKFQDITPQRILGREDTLVGSLQEIGLSAELRFDTDNDWLEISDSGIITGLIADCAITSSKIGDSQVTSNEIADSAVTSAKIADCGIATGDIADCAVTATKIADSGVTSSEIADSAVISAKMSDCAVTNAKLSDSAVSGIKLADSSVTAAKMSDSTLHTRVIEIHATDTSLAVGDTLATFFIPAELDGYDLVRAEAAVKVVSTSGRPTIQIRDVTGSADMLINKITLDSGEKTSFTSDTASSIDTTNDTLATGQEIAIDIDSAGTGTEDLYVILSVRKP